QTVIKALLIVLTQHHRGDRRTTSDSGVTRHHPLIRSVTVGDAELGLAGRVYVPLDGRTDRGIRGLGGRARYGRGGRFHDVVHRGRWHVVPTRHRRRGTVGHRVIAHVD